ncbi:MAG: hypothetical protein R2801_08865 [Chitinophagales bacterium]
MKKILWIMTATMLLSACNSAQKRFNLAKKSANELLQNMNQPSALSYFETPYFNKEQMQIIIGTIMQNCDWNNRATHSYTEKLIEDKEDGNVAIFIYQYYMDCDSIQINMSYNLLNKTPQLISLKLLVM